MLCTDCDESALHHWKTAAKKLAEKLKVREKTVRDLLRDYMLTTLSRWSHDAEKPREHLARAMHKLATNAEHASHVSPTDLSPKENTTGSRVTVPVEVAAKGLGPTGSINMPTHIWDNMSLANFRWATLGPPPPRPSGEDAMG